MGLPCALRWPVQPEKQAMIVAAACVLASWITCVVMLWNFYDLYGGHYSRPLRRYWIMPYAPYAVLAANVVITATALCGCRRGGLFPWVVMGIVKVPCLILEASWGAIGRYTVYIGLLILAYWGFFVMVAYIMLLETERAQERASSSNRSAKALHRRDDDESSFRFWEWNDKDTFSYSAGSEEKHRTIMLSLWLSLLRWIPVADMYASKTTKNVKLMHAGV